MDKIEDLIAELLEATADLERARERQCYAVEAIREAWAERAAVYQEVRNKSPPGPDQSAGPGFS